jgi:hypothetical protein
VLVAGILGRVHGGGVDGAGRGDGAVVSDLDLALERLELAGTVAIPRCLTLKPTLECEGSRFQVPVGTAVAVVLMRFSVSGGRACSK